MSLSTTSKPWVVLKFGGTSVSTKDRWHTIADIVQKRRDDGYRVLLVCSALSQVSNRLESALSRAAEGEAHDDVLEELRREHLELSMSLRVTLNGGESYLDELGNLLEGVRLTHEITPRTHARVLSAGEMLSTRIGAGFLATQGLEVEWLDAREVLQADPVPDPRDPSGRPYLSATCTADPDRELQQQLEGLDRDVYITQGFVAGRDGETVLLGRGGSDTSGSYMAGLVEADRLEIWTDVPGLFTSNPHSIPKARLLKKLPYRVAEELALRGAKVLHPAAIRAAETARVPVHLRWTDHPDVQGTIITDVEPGPPSVKAVTMRKGITLASLRVDSDWQPVGLIADLTSCFKDHGFAIDLLASSPTNLTIALDLAANHRSREDLEPLLADLREYCRPRVIEATATISLVGTGMRALLHHWGNALACFEDEEVHLVSQAANDRSVSFLVQESVADRLAGKLHESIFEGEALGDDFGETWIELETDPSSLEIEDERQLDVS